MRLAVIGTFYRRHERTAELLTRVMVESTRPPDEFWIMCEDEHDAAAVPEEAATDPRIRVQILHTPLDGGGRYSVIPYSNKINWALDRTDADAICYLDNGSMPSPDKFALMLEALEADPLIGAVYCGQQRTGHRNDTVHAGMVIPDAWCFLNYTQVMHRRTDDRWPLDMALADPDLADATFWRSLHVTLGPFHPVAIGQVLDHHHIAGMAAVGV